MPGRSLHALTAAAVLALAACAHSAPSVKETPVSTDAASPSVRRLPVKEWPLRFRSHTFSVASYDTYGCTVFYAGQRQLAEPDDELQPSSASYGPGYLDHLSGGHGMIRNFPPPAVVTWRSKDGQPHRAEIDIGEIFRDELIRHNVAREEMADLPDGIYRNEPSILLEVNDRTIRVWMRAMIFLKKQVEVAGVMRADFRNDLVLVRSYTY